MAHATHTPAITRTEVVEIQPEGITLKLSREEAKALVAVCKRIGGSAADTRRKHFDNIHQALWSAAQIVDNGGDFEEEHCRIYFKAVV